MVSTAEILYEIEQIKRLKARYFRALDVNDWELFESCLTDDCEASYGDGKYQFEGKKAIVKFMARFMSGDKILSIHNGHHPEIDVDAGCTRAEGVWYLQDTVIDLKGRSMLSGAGLYADHYVKKSDSWLIAKTGYTRTFEYVQPLGDGFKVLRNRFSAK